VPEGLFSVFSGKAHGIRVPSPKKTAFLVNIVDDVLFLEDKMPVLRVRQAKGNLDTVPDNVQDTFEPIIIAGMQGRIEDCSQAIEW
jgi:hypothetical protein